MKIAATKRITDIFVYEQTNTGWLHWEDYEMDTGPMPIGVGNHGTFRTELDGKTVYLWSTELLVENFERLKVRHPDALVTIVQRELPWWEMNVVKEGLDPRWFNHPQYGLPRVARTDQNNP